MNASIEQKPAELRPTDIVIFGGTGDLAMRKILPALYFRHMDGQFSDGKVIGTGRTEMSREAYLTKVEAACREHTGPAFNEKFWREYAARVDYVALEAEEPSGYARLTAALKTNPREGRMFYLAVPSAAFPAIAQNLKAAGLITPASRMVLEKPLGQDLTSFREINGAVLSCFSEEQVYRIDHYLGKETVQNLMIIRFANHLFSQVWSSDAVDHVQITVAEDAGVDGRAGYYDQAGALRDMVQNHLLQLLCLVAMEPPHRIDPQIIRDEKKKVLEALQPITKREVEARVVRGQYVAGTVKGKKLQSYAEDSGSEKSKTESFVALKLFVDNWRWSGVPFYLRTGKRMRSRYSEIVLHFRQVPHHLFTGQQDSPESNKLIIRIQPDERIQLQMISKTPGPGGYRLKPVQLNLSLADTYTERVPGAYERLLMDVVRGNPTLFMRSDEVEAAWRWTDGVIQAWKESGSGPLPYEAGTDGPEEAERLLARDGRSWHG